MKMLASVLLILPLLASARGTEIYGEYTVPVNEPGLESFARFPMDIKVDDRGTRVKIEYLLPLQLTGAPHMVEMYGTRAADGSLKLTGPLGEANCASTSCTLRYQNLNIDLNKRDQVLREMTTNNRDLEALTKVANRFHDDPFGIIRLQVPLSRPSYNR